MALFALSKACTVTKFGPSVSGIHSTDTGAPGADGVSTLFGDGLVLKPYR